MKTFHSTAVLRHLFTVHTSLAEFEIGFRALDTYLEIFTKGRARVKKSGVPEPNLDDDETAIRTAAEGISILCRFGSREQAEKARDLGRTLEQWLQKYPTGNPLQTIPNGQEPAMAVHEKKSERSTISSTGLAIAYRAVGISQAHWAEMTYEATTRAEIQATALENLQRSLAPEFGDTDNLETLFALGMLLAKTRDLSNATEVVKRALSLIGRRSASKGPQDMLPQKQAPTEPFSERNDILQKRRFISFWHLLTLLMTAEQDWTTAERSCVAAFAELGDRPSLFGAEDLSQSDKGYEGAAASSNQRGGSYCANRGAVNDMDLYDKQGIVEIKITQMALTEVLEGPEVAVNASDELLSLFTRLFKDLEVLAPRRPPIEERTVPPPSSSGTIKGLRGSLLGRPKTSHRRYYKTNTSASSVVDPGYVNSTVVRRSYDAAAPKIQVTNEDGQAPKVEAHHHHRLFHHESGDRGQKLQKRCGSLNSKKSFASFRRERDSSSTTSASIPGRDPAGVPDVVQEDKVENMGRRPVGDGTISEEYQRATKPTALTTPPRAIGIAMTQNLPPPVPPLGKGHEESANATQPLSNISHNFHPRHQPPPLSHKPQTPHQDVRLPTISPHTSSPKRANDATPSPYSSRSGY